MEFLVIDKDGRDVTTENKWYIGIDGSIYLQSEGMKKVDGYKLRQAGKPVVISPRYKNERCPKCHEILAASDHYCRQCGQKLKR